MQNPYMLLLKYRKLLLSELSNLSSIPREILAEKLRAVSSYIRVSGEEVVVEKPLELALYLAKMGFPLKELAAYIDWRDFEKFAAEILSAHNYAVLTNFLATRPARFEIDVIGVDPGSGRGIFVDCKHWSRSGSRTALLEAMEKHASRVEKFVKYFSWFRDKWIHFTRLREIVPVIVTLTTPVVRAHKSVIAVSIQELNQFLIDIHTVLDAFGIVTIKVKK